MRHREGNASARKEIRYIVMFKTEGIEDYIKK